MKLALRFLILVSLLVSLYLLFPKFLEDNITIVRVYNKTDSKNPIMGTGFFIDKKNIITAAHLVEPEGITAVVGKIEILDEEKHLHPAKVIGFDTDYDIAILNLAEPCNVEPKPACARDLSVRDLEDREVFYSKNYGYNALSVLQDPFNIFYPIYLKGEILGVDLIQAGPAVMYIMHDSAIIPGYSGGPLLDSNDCYLGVNVQVDIYRPKISRAVSLATIEGVVPLLIKNGKLDMPFLGIVFEQTINSVFISGVLENSPAETLNKNGVRVLKEFPVNPDRVVPEDFIEETTYPTHEVIAINDVVANSLSGIWNILKTVPSGSPITILMKNSSGNLEIVTINSGERFSMIRKLTPLGRFVLIRNTLVA